MNSATSGLIFFTMLFFTEYVLCSNTTQESEKTNAQLVTEIVNPTVQPPGECPSIDVCYATAYADITADHSNNVLVCSKWKTMVSCLYEAVQSCGDTDILGSSYIIEKAIADACECTSGSSGITVSGGITRMLTVVLLLHGSVLNVHMYFNVN
ncbi:uncharacterized protein LOC133179424 isoform X2 [Saccostrea echinata]|uniref:uncharacterized protein LOC133179424 isoform X2 n=1 Tax=Saccostrea echinata TaxID=191078 RepID=UPI002A7F9ACE|nr:uncharacterized protein LOC133179424 isoform X2 [Saccostrea echinata]